MQLKSLQIGKTKTENNVFLAPMAGYTDFSFRKLALELGYGLVSTELVSAKGLEYKSKGSNLLLRTDDYNKTQAQIFGSEPYFMRKACEGEYLKDFNIVDINMGCPVPKVYKNGEGSALLNDIKLSSEIIKECVKSGKDITIKIRIGLKEGDDIALDFAKMAEDCGAKLITIHGRVREKYYSGEPNYNAIYKAKKAVSIPVIANGGIFSVEDANKMMENTGADGVMLARGAFENPFLICSLLSKNSPCELKEFMILHLKGLVENYGEKRATLEYRKFVGGYLKGIPNIKEQKIKLLTSNSIEEIIETIDNIF
ncbi:MAG: tRNA-dihydrouridine synthase [Clostridia bacterium]|nr:tRNA-dihydrouridine synthase [Clostridia bacterium]